MLIANDIELWINYDPIDLTLSIGVESLVDPSNAGYADLPLASTTNWINLNIRMGAKSTSNYTLING